MDRDEYEVSLIREVKKRPALWGPNRSNKKERAEAWKEISSELKRFSKKWPMDDRICALATWKKNWTGLRDRFKRKCNILIKNETKTTPTAMDLEFKFMWERFKVDQIFQQRVGNSSREGFDKKQRNRPTEGETQPKKRRTTDLDCNVSVTHPSSEASTSNVVSDSDTLKTFQDLLKENDLKQSKALTDFKADVNGKVASVDRRVKTLEQGHAKLMSENEAIKTENKVIMRFLQDHLSKLQENNSVTGVQLDTENSVECVAKDAIKDSPTGYIGCSQTASPLVRCKEEVRSPYHLGEPQQAELERGVLDSNNGPLQWNSEEEEEDEEYLEFLKY